MFEYIIRLIHNPLIQQKIEAYNPKHYPLNEALSSRYV